MGFPRFHIDFLAFRCAQGVQSHKKHEAVQANQIAVATWGVARVHACQGTSGSYK